MATFEERLKMAIAASVGPRGYEVCMRRSVQTVVLFEAHRAVASKLPTLRPFQRKIAFWGQANAIIESLDCLQDEDKGQIMWRTATSKEPMPPETAWKRLKLIERELAKILASIEPSFAVGRSHDEVCEHYLQQQFELMTGSKGKPHPATFEFTHNNVIFCYRLFYRGLQLDPTFPLPVVRQVEIPAIKPKIGLPLAAGLQHSYPSIGVASIDGAEQHTAAVALSATAAVAARSVDHHGEDDDRDVDLTGIVGGDELHEERRSLLREVREHLDLLREFEGVISQEEIIKRKRELFLSLPPAPPPAMPKRGKRDGSLTSPVQAKKMKESDVETNQG